MRDHLCSQPLQQKVATPFYPDGNIPLICSCCSMDVQENIIRLGSHASCWKDLFFSLGKWTIETGHKMIQVPCLCLVYKQNPDGSFFFCNTHQWPQKRYPVASCAKGTYFLIFIKSRTFQKDVIMWCTWGLISTEHHLALKECSTLKKKSCLSVYDIVHITASLKNEMVFWFRTLS